MEEQDPLMGFKALGIATALVLSSAGLGVLAVSRMLGVNDVSAVRTWQEMIESRIFICAFSDGGIQSEDEGGRGREDASTE